MNDYLFDYKNNYEWVEIKELLIAKCISELKVIKKTADYSNDIEIQKLISPECIKNCDGLINLLSMLIDEKLENVGDSSQYIKLNAIKLNGWIILGSLTETLLQMFMTIYLQNYKDANWQIWNLEDPEAFKNEILDYVSKYPIDDEIYGKYIRSIKKNIIKTIDRHTELHKIEMIGFNELIQLYNELDLLDAKEIEELKKIQNNRNGIHSFAGRKINSWDDLKHSTGFLIYLFEWIDFRLPDIPENDFHEQYFY